MEIIWRRISCGISIPWPNEESTKKTAKEFGEAAARKDKLPQLNVFRTTETKGSELLRGCRRMAKNGNCPLAWISFTRGEACQSHNIRKKRIGKNVHYFLWAKWAWQTIIW